MISARTRRGNRLGLMVIGIVLLLGGAAAVARGAGLFGASAFDTNPRAAHEALLTPTDTHYVHHAGWFWPVVAAIAIVVALLCIRWLLVQLRLDRAGTMQLEPDRTHGATEVDTGALVDAVEDEIAAYPGVAKASGRLVGTQRQPELHLVVKLEERADLLRVRQLVTERALAHLRQALDVDELAASVTLRVDAARLRRRAA